MIEYRGFYGEGTGERQEAVRTICFGLYTILTRWRQGGSGGMTFAPNDTSTIEDVVMVISRRPCGDDLLVDRNFNANLADP